MSTTPRAQEVDSALGQVRRGSFELHLDGLTSFGGRKPRAAVATVAPVPPLLELQHEHERLMQRIGLEPEGRKIHAACDAGAVAGVVQPRCCRVSRGAGSVPHGAVSVMRFVLFSARASVGGGPYVVEASYPLITPA